MENTFNKSIQLKGQVRSAVQWDGSLTVWNAVHAAFPKSKYLRSEELIIIPTETGNVRIGLYDWLIVTDAALVIMNIPQFNNLFEVINEPETINS